MAKEKNTKEIIKEQEETLTIEELKREKELILEKVAQLEKEKEELIVHNQKLFLRQAAKPDVRVEEEKEEVKIDPQDIKGIWRL